MDKTSLEYFDQIYADNTDPWAYETRWYEQRKRDICLSLLSQPHYKRGIELGCSNGVLSEQLARRCHSLLCLDGHPKAVALASKRLQALSHVVVMQGLIPTALPNKPFDLIVISEILYYLSQVEIKQVTDWLRLHLAEGGTLLACHWRYPIAGFEVTGEEVHRWLDDGLPFLHQASLTDRDFLLDIWVNHSHTIAMQEGLVDTMPDKR